MADDKTREPTADYWPAFSYALKSFKLLGLMPLNLKRIKNNNSDKLKVEFSKPGFAIAIMFFVLTLIHAIWAPTMLIKLEKSIVATFSVPIKFNRNMTIGLHRRTFNTKLAVLVKILHPVLISVTALTARILSLSMMAKSLPVLFKALAAVDRLLNLPSKFYLAHFGTLTAVTALTYVLHIPVLLFHFSQLFRFNDFWGNLLESFSLFNVFTSFSLELEFVLFCLTVRSRFKYVNNLMTTLISEEFIYDVRSGGSLKKIFSKWKGYNRPRTRKIVTSNAKSRGELFKLFSKMDATNGGRYVQTPAKVSLIDVGRSKKSPEPETSTLLKSLRSGHVLLFDVLEHMNHVYQVHLLVSIFSSVTKVLFNFYFAIFGFITTPVKQVPIFIQRGELHLITVWSVYYCLRFMLIVNFAHVAASSSKDAVKIISKIDPRALDFSSKQEIKMFSEHLNRREFQFSACGLFNLNTSLISTSFSTGITYLVIMAQFH